MIEKIQKELAKQNLDGWLMYDFHRTNMIAVRFLQIPQNSIATRRVFYWIPQKGKPVKITHKIESKLLDHCEGKSLHYFSLASLKEVLKNTLPFKAKIAMEISEEGNNPYISKVDAGTVHLLESLGMHVRSSEHLLTQFYSVLSEKQIESHKQAAQFLDETAKRTWKWIVERYKKNRKTREFDVQQFILEQFTKHGFETEESPICAVNENSANPHYAPIAGKDKEIQKGSMILIDLWCKKSEPHSIYGDITRMAVLDTQVSEEYQKVYQMVRETQKVAVTYIQKHIHEKPITGAEVDKVARDYIEKMGYGSYFLHRLGHSIDEELHGSGTHLDSLEIVDQRTLLPATCCSIEPGIYMSGKFGVRLEHDLLITLKREVLVTGGVVEMLPALLG